MNFKGEGERMDNFPARIPIPPFLFSFSSSPCREKLHLRRVRSMYRLEEGGRKLMDRVLALTLSILLTVYVYLEFKAR